MLGGLETNSWHGSHLAYWPRDSHEDIISSADSLPPHSLTPASLSHSCLFCLSCPSHLCATCTPHEQTKSRANDTQVDRSLPNPSLPKFHLLGSSPTQYYHPPHPPPPPTPDVSVWLCGHCCCMGLQTLQTTTALIGRFVFSF